MRGGQTGKVYSKEEEHFYSCQRQEPVAGYVHRIS